MSDPLTRRRTLRTIAGVGIGAIAAGCGSGSSDGATVVDARRAC